MNISVQMNYLRRFVGFLSQQYFGLRLSYTASRYWMDFQSLAQSYFVLILYICTEGVEHSKSLPSD